MRQIRAFLFDGEHLDGWRGRHGDPANWRIEEGALVVEPGSGDIVSLEQHRDAHLHIEFRCPLLPDATGQKKANSGCYIQGRYEIQVLDSYGANVPGTGDCGAVYAQHAPLVNACRPPEQWQELDLIFRAPRSRPGRPIAAARLTALLNGQVIHNNARLLPTQGASDEALLAPGPLRLQDHGDRVAFRNIWLTALPESGSDHYQPG